MTQLQNRIENLERRAPKYRDYVPLVTGRLCFIGRGFNRIRPASLPDFHVYAALRCCKALTDVRQRIRAQAW